MTKFKVYVTDYDNPDVNIERDILTKEVDAEILELHTRDPKILMQKLKDADAILTQYAPMNREIISSLKKCQVIARYGIGYDNVDVESCTENGIIVLNVPSYCEEEVSDSVIAMSYALTKKLNFYHKNLLKEIWDWKPGVPIHRFDKLKAGLLGFGNISKFAAKKFKALGLEVMVNDPFISDEIFEEHGVKKVTFDKLIKESDILSIHVPLTPKTKHLLGKKEFDLMKNTAIIINTSRGAIIDENALINALHEKSIAAAGLDVFENEPVSKDNPLLSMDNVIATPHCGWYSEESKIEIRKKIATNVLKVLKGEEPYGFVNKKELGRV
ncbi:MAG: D-3-phosphoglycerate dehydrogenase / 2-oxoglutarate reductase [Kosmotogales bacterium]|nr:D-3-phosphoglycerate dehydrogenase / 2-oxoglutarate reductase [Kosmotogales bacterium]